MSSNVHVRKNLSRPTRFENLLMESVLVTQDTSFIIYNYRRVHIKTNSSSAVHLILEATAVISVRYYL